MAAARQAALQLFELPAAAAFPVAYVTSCVTRAAIRYVLLITELVMVVSTKCQSKSCVVLLTSAS